MTHVPIRKQAPIRMPTNTIAAHNPTNPPRTDRSISLTKLPNAPITAHLFLSWISVSQISRPTSVCTTCYLTECEFCTALVTVGGTPPQPHRGTLTPLIPLSLRAIKGEGEIRIEAHVRAEHARGPLIQYWGERDGFRLSAAGMMGGGGFNRAPR